MTTDPAPLSAEEERVLRANPLSGVPTVLWIIVRRLLATLDAARSADPSDRPDLRVALKPHWAETVSVEDALVGMFAQSEGDEEMLREGFGFIRYAARSDTLDVERLGDAVALALPSKED